MSLKNVELKEKNSAELTVEVGAEEFDAAIEKVYKKSRGRISVPGFRKGKAPRRIIEGMYGADVFYEDAINELYPAALEAAIAEANLDVVGRPKVDMEGEAGKNGFTFKAVVGIRPVAKLGAYKGLTAPMAPVEITEEDVANELKPYIERATRLVSVDREVKNGDTTIIDFEGLLDGQPFQGGTAEKYSLVIGSGSFIPGFEEQLVGMKAGENKDINVTFPENYSPELSGKDVVFKIKLHEVKEPVAPELDDEFAKDVSEFETLAELKYDLSDKLKARREETARKAFEDDVIDQVVAGMECEIPDAMIDYEVDMMMEDFAAQLQRQGIPFDSYLAMTGNSLETLKFSARGNAVKRVQAEVAMTAVAKAEGLTVTEEDMESEYKRLAEEHGITEERVREILPPKSLEKEILLTRATKLVIDSAVPGEAAPAKKPAKKAASKKKEETEGEEKKPAKKTAAKKTAKAEDGEEKKPAKKAAAKKDDKTEE